MSKIKIYDCSNSDERPVHRRSSLCPPINDICNDLFLYVSDEKNDKFEYVIDPDDADVIFTNDVYPQSIIDIKKPKVKRMDGIFWQKNLMKRNDCYAKAARLSDYVIFISNFSKKCFEKVYGINCVKNGKVVLNDAPEWIFYPKIKSSDKTHVYWPKLNFATCASNWEREEKRFNSLIKFIKIINSSFKNIHVNIIGECYFKHENVTCHGYIEREETAEVLRDSDAFINLSYMDAAPKTVCQAIRCGLPVLYANSGGVSELVGINGFSIPDDIPFFSIKEKVHELNEMDICKTLEKFLKMFSFIRSDLLEKQNQQGNPNFISYRKCLDFYLETFIQVA